jgi:glycosyltransferase involved in cell wall biosynthesis
VLDLIFFDPLIYCALIIIPFFFVIMQYIPFRKFSAGTGISASYKNICRFEESLSEHQLVSCVMVTRGDMDLIYASYSSFKSQSWKNCELVIVCDNVGDELRSLADEDCGKIRLVEVQNGAFTLGDLRNLSVARARGEFICQWDDDDLYDPDRISISMKVLIESSVEAVFLCRWLMWWEKRGLLSISPSRIWEGSLFARKSAISIYPSIAKGEDSVVTDWITKYYSISLIDYPQLYCYRVTGQNTWTINHFEQLFGNSSKAFKADEFITVFKLPCFQFAYLDKTGKQMSVPVTYSR